MEGKAAGKRRWPPGTLFQFFPGWCKILTEFLWGGGAKYEKQYFVGKTQKSHYFFNSGVQIPPPLPPPNDVPNDHRSHSLAYAEL